MPVRKGRQTEGIVIRELKGGKAVALIHKGAYDQIGRSWEKLMRYVKERELGYSLPLREVYIKGPGMIFKGKPRNYLTELQILVREGE